MAFRKKFKRKYKPRISRVFKKLKIKNLEKKDLIRNY